jgi:cell division transport system ATP-binding protein
MPHQLSGGEQQRLVIARALLNEPLLLIADEPTGNLDPEVSQEIMKLFISINNSGTSILMATHDHDLFEKFPARTLVCRNSTIEEAKAKTA